ncbi:helix-turn-helix transcriptional regulator [Empedobacter falsenii]
MIINRIKVVLVEKNITNKYLANKLNKSEVTVSRWCTNEIQPSLENLYHIAKLLRIDIRDLLHKTDFEDEE